MRATNHEGTIVKVKTGYQCKIYVGDKKQKYICATRKTATQARQEAKAKYKRFLKERVSALPDVSARRSEKLEASISKYFEEYALLRAWKDSTKIVNRERVNNLIIKKIGSLSVKDLSASVINDLLKRLLAEYSRDNVGKVYHFLRHYIHDLSINGIIETDFFSDIIDLSVHAKRKVSPDDSYKIFSEEEVQKLEDYALYYVIAPVVSKADLTLKYYYNIFYLMVLTGMRGQEIRALQLDDIDFKDHYINIRYALSKAIVNGKQTEVLSVPKTRGSKRKIQITKDAEACLHYIIENRPSKKSNFICCTSTGSFIINRIFNKYFDRVLQSLEIEKNNRSPHNLRHTFISLAMDHSVLSPLADKSALFISNYVGHSKLSTTMDIYSHIHGNVLSGVDHGDPETIILDLDVDFS